MYDDQIAVIREKAKQKRYKKPAHKDLNLESIQYSLWDILEACAEVEYYFEGDDTDLFSELVGGDDQFQEFKFMFSGLSADCEQMMDDLKDGWVPRFFDTFFAALSDHSQTMLGWDTYENDYFGLEPGFESEIAIKEAKKKLQQYTKADLIEAASQCFLIAVNFLSLRSRYEDLKASMDIIRETNKAELDVLRHINELYQKADEVSKGFRYDWKHEVIDLQKLIDSIDPQSRIWLQ